VNIRVWKIGSFIFCLLLVAACFSAFANAQRYSWVSLTVNVNMSGAGYVNPGSGSYYYGDNIVLREYTNLGYSFDGWYVDGSYQGKLSNIPLSMTANHDVVAVFSKRIVGLSITCNPSGAGTLAPNPGVWTYNYGDNVIVKQYPTGGNTFSGWYLDGTYLGAGTSITVNMNGDHQIVAYFSGSDLSPTPTTDVNPTPTVTPPPSTTPTATPIPMPVPTPSQAPDSNLPKPNLVFFCTSATQFSGFNVKIDGRLSYNDVGISGAGMLFSYSVTGGATWQDLAYVITDDAGGFSAVWMPFATGNYQIKASWGGDELYSKVSTVVNYALTPSTDQTMFSVTSNSTLSSFTFDSTKSELDFSVSGASGTTGYVQVSIPKAILNDASTLKITLDNSQVAYHAETRYDNWIVSFEYHHSSHNIKMDLNAAPSSSNNSDGGSQGSIGVGSVDSPWMIIAIVAVVIAAVALVISVKSRGGNKANKN
jgi:hypothetical protein